MGQSFANETQIGKFRCNCNFNYSLNIYDALRDLMQLDNLKTMRNNHGELQVLVKFEALVCNFTKSMTPPLVFFTSFLNCANRT